MTCKTCKAPMPDAIVATECEACIDRRQTRGYDEYQLEFLRNVHAGRWQLITHQVPHGGKHIQKFGVRMSFCGKVIVPIPKYKAYAPYDNATLDQVCPACAAAVRAAMQEALAMPAATVAKEAK